MDSDSKPFQHLLQLLLAILRCLISSMLNLIINNRLLSSSFSSSEQNDDVFYPTRATTFTALMVKDALTSTTYGDIITTTTSSSSSSCAVCLNRMRKKDRVRRLRCCHVFHAECIDRWIDYNHNVSCPLCRTPFVGPGYSGVGPAQPSWAVERLLYLFGDDLPICDPVMAHTL